MNTFIDERELDERLLEFFVLRQTFEEKTSQLIKKQLFNDLSIFLFSIKRTIELHNYFKEIEENFQFVENISVSYNKAITKIQKVKESLTEDELKNILSGILELLIHNEKEIDQAKENKIYDERVEIIANAIIKIQSLLRENINEKEYAFPSGLSDVESKKWIQDLLYKTILNHKQDIKDIFNKTIDQLNSLEERPAVTEYLECIRKQKKALIGVVNIEVGSFENAISGEELDELSDAFSIVNSISHKIETIYEELLKKVNSIFIDKNETNALYESIFQQDKMIESVLRDQLIKLYRQYQLDKHRIISMLYQKIMDRYKEVISQSKNQIMDHANKIIILSLQINEWIDSCRKQIHLTLKEKIDDTEALEILKGISATLDIKYGQIKEKNESFLIGKKEEEIFFEKETRIFATKLKDFMNALYLGNLSKEPKEEMLFVQNQFFQLKKSLQKKQLKKNIDFLKYGLLFEVSTFDELIKESIEKLRFNQLESIQLLIDHIDQSYHKIFELIEDAGLEIINPKPKEKFSGKLHEIILVEEESGFNKGEIVSTKTIGFKKDQLVIIRAHVIVAK